MYCNLSIEALGNTRTFGPDFLYAHNYVSWKIHFTFCFHLAYHNQITRVIMFPCNLFFKYQRSAIFRKILCWCHVKSGITTLMFDLVIVTGMTSTSQVLWLAAEQKVNKRNLVDPKLEVELDERCHKTVAQNHYRIWELSIFLTILFR